MTVHIIVNAARTGEKKIAKVCARFAAAGVQTEVHRTLRKGHAAEIAAEITSRGERLTIAVMGAQRHARL